MKIYSLVLLLHLPIHCQAAMTISVTDVPEYPGGRFKAQVVAGPTPGELNPCSGRGVNCNIRMYTIDESWLPQGRERYNTVDRGYESPSPASKYRTLAGWWSAVTNKNRIGEDYLNPVYGDRPCVVLAASDDNGRMVSGTIVSNCAKGIVQARTCDLTPHSIVVDLPAVLGGPAPTVKVDNVTLTCNDNASVLLETNTGERIPLGGRPDSYAILDWGAGFGRPQTVEARRNIAENLPLRVRGVGLDFLGAGQFTGSAIVNVSYN